jgi:hypothetical protein
MLMVEHTAKAGPTKGPEMALHLRVQGTESQWSECVDTMIQILLQMIVNKKLLTTKMTSSCGAPRHPLIGWKQPATCYKSNTNICRPNDSVD